MKCRVEGARLTQNPGVLKLLDDPAVPLPSICPKESKAGTLTDIGYPVHSISQKVAKRWRQPKCPSMDEQISKNVVCPHGGILLGLKKGGDFWHITA